MARDAGTTSPSPLPSAQLLCTVHNRMRTRRNLIRSEGGLWCCKPDEPCLTGGKGSQRGNSGGVPAMRRERAPRFPSPEPRFRRSPSRRQRRERRSRSRRRRRRHKRRASRDSDSRRRSHRSRHSRRAPTQDSEPTCAAGRRRRRSRSSSRSGTTASRESSRTPSRRRSPSSRMVAAEAALKAFAPDAADAPDRASEDILDPAGAFSQRRAIDGDPVAGRPFERQHSAGSDSDHSGSAAYTNRGGRAAAASADQPQLCTDSPSPDRQLVCKIHGRYRTRRNLRRVPGSADEWCCTQEEPCLLPGQAPPGRQRRGFNQPQPMPVPGACLLEPNSVRPTQRWGAPTSSKDWLHGAPLHSRLEESERSGAPHRDSIDFTTLDQRSSADKLGETAPTEPFEDKSDPLNLLSLPSPKRSAGPELVLCSSHGKWRHPDRMARKANGDWVCTGDDACKVSDNLVPQPDPLATSSTTKRGVGRLSTKGPSTLTRIKGIPRLRLRGPGLLGSSPSRRGRQTSDVEDAQVGRVRTSSFSSGRGSSDGAGDGSGTAVDRSRTPRRGARAPPVRGGTRPPRSRASRDRSIEATPEGRRNKHRGRVKGRSRTEDEAMSSSAPVPGTLDENNDGRPLPPGTMFCALHRKPRFPERLEKRDGQWVCKAGDRCRNVDEVKCTIHGRWRTVQNMESIGGGNFKCRAGCECR